MQFAVIARDGESMLEKRMEVRPRHLANLAASKDGRVMDLHLMSSRRVIPPLAMPFPSVF